MKNIIVSFRMLLAVTLLTGLVYPLAVTVLAQGAWKDKANGSLALKEGKPVGSTLLAQATASPLYFWPRPSAIEHNPLPSSGSNLGPTSGALKKAAEERRAVLLKAHPGQGEVPPELCFASSSGLDPHLSPEATRWQVARVAAARRLEAAQLLALVDAQTEKPQYGIFGGPRVNVLTLNLALDGLQ